LGQLNILIVDPGEYTLDWLLMTPAGPAGRVSSAASDAGRHRIVREVHKLISEKLGRPLGNSFFTDIDEALRVGKTKKLRVAGQVFDLTEESFQKAIEFAVEDPVRQLFAGLRGAEDRVDLVAVFGGSPVEVADALRKSRPNLPVYCPSDASGQDASLFANLRGFQEWAEEVDAKSVPEAVIA
jgi:plasmid segregation protein ParM